MTLKYIVLSLLLVGVLPAHCQDAAKAWVQQDDGSLSTLEHQLSIFLEDLAQALQVQEGRLLTLEEQNKGLLQSINQQGAAQMEAVKEVIEDGLQQMLNCSAKEEVPDTKNGCRVMRRMAAGVQTCQEEITTYQNRLMPAFVFPWFVMKVLFLVIVGDFCMEKVVRFADNSSYMRQHQLVAAAVALSLCSFGAYLVYLFVLDLIAWQLRLFV